MFENNINNMNRKIVLIIFIYIFSTISLQIFNKYIILYYNV